MLVLIMCVNKTLLFVFMCLFVGLSSCTRKIEYTYEEVVVTRYDYSRYSEYYCNTSDTKYKIRISGIQNFYKAWLCINRETKKVWILRYDCWIEQSAVDYDNFEAELYQYPNSIDSLHLCELKEIKMLKAKNTQLLEQKYAIYLLYGGKTYVDAEKKYNPHSLIHAQYTSHYSLLDILQIWISKVKDFVTSIL